MYHSCHRRKKLTWESPLPFDITQPSSVITHAPFYASTHADLFTSIQALQQDFPLCRVGPSSYHTTGCHAVLQSICMLRHILILQDAALNRYGSNRCAYLSSCIQPDTSFEDPNQGPLGVCGFLGVHLGDLWRPNGS